MQIHGSFCTSYQNSINFFHIIKRKRTHPFWINAYLCANKDRYPLLQERSLVLIFSSLCEDEILPSEGYLSFEGVLSTCELDGTDAVIHMDEAKTL